MLDALTLLDPILALQTPASEVSIAPDQSDQRSIWSYVGQGVLFAIFVVLIRHAVLPAARAARSRMSR